MDGKMLVSKRKIEIPDICPPDCKFRGDISQGGWCHRCPVLNCGGTLVSEDEYYRDFVHPNEKNSHPYPKDGYYFRLLEPENYREDWTEEWKKFFDGEVEYPVLRFLEEKETKNE